MPQAAGSGVRPTAAKSASPARSRTVHGADHPFLARKPATFDAPCIHYDEVTALPDTCTVFAFNRHSAVQAAVVPLGRSEVWGVQYHPEFDIAHIAHIAGLLRLYAADMVEQGYFASHEDQAAYQSRMEAVAARPGDGALQWQLGLDANVLDPAIRADEIIPWFEQVTGLSPATLR